MNKQRRGDLKNVKAIFESALAKLESIKDDEEFAFDNMPENLQYSIRGEESQEAIENLDMATEKISEATDLISEAIELIEEVI